MLRILSCCIVVLYFGAEQSHAQITFDRTDFENILYDSKRLNYHYGFGSGTTLDLGMPSSSSQDFDFSGTPSPVSSETTHVTMVSPTGQPGAENFPDATLCSPISYSPSPGVITTEVTYFRLADDGFYLEGVYYHDVSPAVSGDTVIVEKFRGRRLLIPLPAAHGTSRTERDTLDVDKLLNIYIAAKRTVTIDGFGSFTRPPARSSVPAKPTLVSALRMTTDEIQETYFGGVFAFRERKVSVSYLTTDGLLLEMNQADTNYSGGNALVYQMELSERVGTSGIRSIPDGIPDDFSISQNYPNPFNPSTAITFKVSSSEFVSIKVYDLLGREITELVGRVMQPGTYEVAFNAVGLPSGFYVYRMVSGSFVANRKMNIIR